MIAVSKNDYAVPIPQKLYVDSKAGGSTDIAVSKLFTDVLHIEPLDGIESVRITTTFTNRTRVVTIPGALRFKIEKGISSEPAAQQVEDNIYPWLSAPQQWRTIAVNYKNLGTSFNFRGSNALTAKLTILEEPEE